MTKLAVLDGDILAFRCSAANEKRTVIATHNETLEEQTFKTATEFKAWVKDDGNFAVEDFTLLPVQTAEPVENALHSLKQSIHGITAKAKCDNYHIVISGKNNFRLDLPLPTRYKACRKDSVRPLLLQPCLDYLVAQHEAEISDGCEADDVLVGYAYQGYKDSKYIVQCSIDKDAKSGPGWLFDWTTMNEPELIEGYGAMTLTLRDTGKKSAKGEPVNEKIIKGKGRAFLWYQILLGDFIDGYKPCELAKAKFGEIGAYDLLKNAKTDKEALEVLVGQYKRWYPKPVTYRAWDDSLHTKDWLEIMQIYADCAWMRRWEGDQLDMPKLLTRQGVKH